MKEIKRLMIKSLCLLMIVSALITPMAYASTYQLTIDQVMDMAVEESSDYRSLKSTEESINQQKRQAEFGASMTAFSREKYYEFIDMYYREPAYDDDDENDGGQVDRDKIIAGEVVGPFYFQHLIDMDQSRLMDYYARSMASLAENNSPSYIAKVMEEEKFIMYLLQFGNDQPGLTREDKFYKFIRTEELTKIQAENATKQFENGLLAIRNAVSAGANQLYMQYYSAIEGLKITEDNLIVRRKMFDDVANAYALGQFSQVAYERQKMSLEIEALKYEQMQLDVSSLQKAFNKMIGLPLDANSNLIVETDKSVADITGTIEDAYKHNLDLANLQLKMAYSKRELELMEAYLDLDDYHQDYEDVKDQVADYEREYQRISDNILVNYAYAVDDLNYKKQKMESDKVALKVAKKEYENGQLMYGLGLLKVSDLNGLGLQYMSSNMNYSNAQLAYEQAITNMELLVSYGVEYK